MSTVTKEHREAAAIARYPQSGAPAEGSWCREWIEGRFSNFGSDEVSLNAIAQALADLESRIRREQSLDGWACGVLDAYADKHVLPLPALQPRRTSVSDSNSPCWIQPEAHATGGNAETYWGATPALARLAAARALLAADPSLGVVEPGSESPK